MMQIVGTSYVGDLGALRARFAFEPGGRMTFAVIDGGGLVEDGHTETVDVDIAEIREDVALISWQEANGSTVGYAVDFAASTVRAISTVGGVLYRMSGTFSPEG